MDDAWQVVCLDPGDADDARQIGALRADPRVDVVDTLAAQRADLARALRGGRDGAVLGAAAAEAVDAALARAGERWIWRPWARSLIRMLGPAAYRRLRTDRNRYRIRADEQARLASRCVAVAGLSVGQAIAVCMAQEGVAGHFRLADPDHLDVSNLNRLRASVADLGVSKAALAARAIADVDPYLDLDVLAAGVQRDDLDALLVRADGRPVDLLVEECDALPLKIALRLRARALGVPVLMATTEGGVLDVERFDLEPDRPLFHGLAAGVDLGALLAGDADARTAFVLAVMGRDVLSARTAASMIELGETVASWPQLASAVALGAAQVCDAARRIGLGEPCPSGRRRLDLGAGPATAPPAAAGQRAAAPADTAVAASAEAPPGSRRPLRVADPRRQALLELATSAPSGGNAQPWCFAFEGGDLLVYDRPEARVPGMDPDRQSVVMAAGAIAETVALAAPNFGLRARCEVLVAPFAPPSAAAPICRLRLDDGPSDARVDPLAAWLSARCTNRRLHQGPGLDEADRLALHAAAASAHARLTLAEAPAVRLVWGTLAGAADRLRFLHPPWRDELAAEVLFDGDGREGLAVDTLELTPAARLGLPLLLDPAVLAELRAIGGGDALRRPAERAFAASAAIALLDLSPDALGPTAAEPPLFAAGRALQRVWLAATARGLGVHPWGSALFLRQLARPPGRDGLPAWLQVEIDALAAGVDAALPADAALPFMLLRLSRCPPPTARARRLPPLAAVAEPG